MPGYSETPLAKKLGMKAGAVVLCINEPSDYHEWLAPIPDGLQFTIKIDRFDSPLFAVKNRAFQVPKVLSKKDQARRGNLGLLA